jgi:hydrogenase maturation protease
MDRIGVIGIGNPAQQDDGIGVWLVEEMMKRAWPPEVELVSLGPRVHEIPHHMIEKEVFIIVDAFYGGGEPGIVFFLEYPELLEVVNKKRFFEGPYISIHDASFGYWLASGFYSGFNPKVLFIGVQPATIDFGYGLSPQLQVSFPELVLSVESLIRDICEDKCTAEKVQKFTAGKTLKDAMK